jgi:hypothetical protein
MSISRFRRILTSALVAISLSVSAAGSTAPIVLQFIKVVELHALLVRGTPPALGSDATPLRNGIRVPSITPPPPGDGSWRPR